MPLPVFDIALKESFLIAPLVKHFVFEITDQSTFDFIPGQFIRLHLKDDEANEKVRSFSLANQQNPTKTLEFAASYIKNGLASECLFNLEKGDSLKASGPFGKLVLGPKFQDFKRHIFVATGTGVTPYLTMLPTLEKALNDKSIDEVIILLGVRTREDLLYGKTFIDFANQHDKAKFLACYSREKSDLATHELLGYVQKQFAHLSLNPKEDKIYLCGNPAMIDEAFSYLKEQEFSNQQIVREKYISPK